MRKTLTFKNAYEEHPKKSGEYLCYIDGEWVVLHYSYRHGLFNANDDHDYKSAKKHSIKVTYWANLPKEL